MGYSAYDASGGIALYLEAHDSTGTLLDSDNDMSNLRFWDNNPSGPGTLRLDWDGTDPIAYVLTHDTGNFWIADNIRTDATWISVIPAPSAFLLFSIGVSFAGWLRRGRTL